MKKNFIYMLAVALISTCMVACSSGDDSATNENTTPQKGDRQVILTGRIEKPMTRSTVDDQGNSEWQENDQIAVRYQKADDSYGVATATITQTGVTWANFTATLDNPKTGDSNVTLVYPYSAYNSTAPSFIDYTQLSTQYGTLADIGENRNIQSNTATVTVDGSTATLKASVLLNTNVCISKFVLKDSNGNAVNADGLIVKEGSSATYDVTAAAKTNTFYVAMAPFSGNVEIEIKGVKNYPVLSATSSSLPEYGEFIVVKTDDDAHQAYIERSSAENKKLTATGVTLAAGEFYNQNLTVSGYKRIAVTAYVGDVDKYCDHFIALALSDATNGLTDVVTLTAGQAKVNTWIADKSLKIDNTPYVGLSGTKGRYDNVKANPQNSSNHFKSTDPETPEADADPTTVVSNESATTLYKGWRLPTVTDFRRIFSQLKDGSNNPVISGITATNPKGIMDHNGKYGYHDGSSWHWNTDAGYFPTGPRLTNNINALFDGGSGIFSQYYWLGSGVIEESQTTPTDSKGWRYNFSYDYFVWNQVGTGEEGDKALIRLVFAL